MSLSLYDINYSAMNVVKLITLVHQNLADKKFNISRKTLRPDPCFIGSRRIFSNTLEGEFPTFSQVALSSDIDMAVKLSPFQVEWFIDRFGMTAVEKLDPEADYSHSVGAKKEVYRTSFASLLPTREESDYFPHLSDYLIALPKDFNPSVDIIVTPDLRALKRVWGGIDPNFFINFCWKQSPTFMGKPALTAIFSQLESLAMEAVGDERSVKLSLKPVPASWAEAFAPAGGLVQAAPEIVWDQPQEAGAQF